jgi:hypothetical protein
MTCEEYTKAGASRDIAIFIGKFIKHQPRFLFMDLTNITISIIGVFVIGIITISIISYFGWEILKKIYFEMKHYYEWISRGYFQSTESVIETFLSKQNDFWTLYGQFILATFVVLCITILLLNNTISAEAGLPLLAAIVSYVIGKGVSVTKSDRPEKKEQPQKQVDPNKPK